MGKDEFKIGDIYKLQIPEDIPKEQSYYASPIFFADLDNRWVTISEPQPMCLVDLPAIVAIWNEYRGLTICISYKKNGFSYPVLKSWLTKHNV